MVSLKKSLFVSNKKCSNGRNSKLRREEIRTLFSNWQQVSYYRDKYKCKIRMTTIPNEILTEVKGNVTELKVMQVLM